MPNVTLETKAEERVMALIQAQITADSTSVPTGFTYAQASAVAVSRPPSLVVAANLIREDETKAGWWEVEIIVELRLHAGAVAEFSDPVYLSIQTALDHADQASLNDSAFTVCAGDAASFDQALTREVGEGADGGHDIIRRLAYTLTCGLIEP